VLQWKIVSSLEYNTYFLNAFFSVLYVSPLFMFVYCLCKSSIDRVDRDSAYNTT
jgi:hypothetical protein